MSRVQGFKPEDVGSQDSDGEGASANNPSTNLSIGRRGPIGGRNDLAGSTKRKEVTIGQKVATSSSSSSSKGGQESFASQHHAGFGTIGTGTSPSTHGVGGSPNKVPKASKYKYYDLTEIATDLKANMGQDNYRKLELCTYGVVVSYSLPKKLNRVGKQFSKYSASYFLADPSQPESFEANVNLQVFGDKLEDFPIIRSVGDVLRCHRVNAQYYNGLQLVAPSPRKGRSNPGFVTVHRKFDPTTGLQSASSNNNYVREDQEFCLKRSRTMWNRAQEARLEPSKYGVYSVSEQFTWDEEDQTKATRYLNWGSAMTASTSMRDKVTPLVDLRSLEETFKKQRPGPETLKVDTVAVFVGLIGSDVNEFGGGDPDTPVPGVKALFYDGSLPDSIGLGPGVTRETLRALVQTMHAASVYSEVSTVDYNGFQELRDRVVMPAQDPPTSFWSRAAVLTVNSRQAQLVLNRTEPGTWLRMRNVHNVHVQFSELDAPSIDTDTHLVPVPPYSMDTTLRARAFKVWITTVADRMNAASQNEAAVAEARKAASAAQARLSSGPESHNDAMEVVKSALNDSHLHESVAGVESIAHHNSAAEMAPPRRSLVSTTGEELTTVTLVQCTPAPAKFCCRARITGFYPKSLNKWVTSRDHFREQVVEATGDSNAVPRGMEEIRGVEKEDEDGGNEDPSQEDMSLAPSVQEMLSGVPQQKKQPKHPPKEFLFSLCVADDTAEMDLIFSGKDAEFLLGGVTADRFYKSVMGSEEREEKLVDAVGEKLKRAMEGGAVFQFYIRSYTDNVGLQTARQYKRFSGYSVKL